MTGPSCSATKICALYSLFEKNDLGDWRYNRLRIFIL